MKRALVSVATFAILGTSACSSSNPIPPAHLDPVDSGADDRPATVLAEAGTTGTDTPIFQTKDGGADAPVLIVGDALRGIDAGPLAKVTVTIQGLVASSADGGPVGSPDGGASSLPVFANTDRLAPTVRVLVEPQGGDPTGDVVVSVSATLTQAGATTTAAKISLNQTDYAVVGSAKSYGYSDTPFDLAKLATGLYTLSVTAVTAGGSAGSATTSVYVDGGPAIMFLTPADNVFVKGSVLATVVVLDDHAGVASVSFSVGQVPIPADHVTSNGAQYTVTLDFGSFNPPLDGPQILTVTAVNRNGVVAIASRRFTVDNEGPTISSTKPATGGLIGTLITIEAAVADPAGVMESSVVAVVAHGDVHFEVHLQKGTDGVYRKIFDTTQLPIYALFPSISFRAQDTLGNESSVGYLVSLDNTPPIFDLDPPEQVRLIKRDGICSWPFDPVGPDAVDDGSTVKQLFDIRARIEDRGNTPRTGVADFVPIAGVDPATVKVLILDDTSLPLVVDTSDPPNGICDDINPNLVPSVDPQSSRDAQLLDMTPMTANGGAADFSPQPGVFCSGFSTPPLPLCDSTYSSEKGAAMTYSLAYGSGLPAVWTVPPIVAGTPQCAGRQFDSSNNLHDGWACVAVMGADKLGNRQVSRPIRICIAAQPGSTVCSPAESGGSKLASVLLPSATGVPIVIATKEQLLGVGGAPIVAGDTLEFTHASPEPVAVLAGIHKVTPVDASGKQFFVTDVAYTPYDLWLDDFSAVGPQLKGPVGLLLSSNGDIQVLTDSAATELPNDFNGAVIVKEHGVAATAADPYWAPDFVTPTGFTLPGSARLRGFTILASKLPNCTGTVLKSATGAASVDGSKHCTPWAAYPKTEWIEIP